MYQITLSDQNKTVQAAPGETLLEVLRRAGAQPDAPCGGHGRCGKCRVQIRKNADDASWEEVLSCQTTIDADLAVRAVRTEADVQVLTEGTAAGGGDRERVFRPAVRQVCVNVRPCPKGESISDWTRLEEALRAATDPLTGEPLLPGGPALTGEPLLPGGPALTGEPLLSGGRELPVCLEAASSLGRILAETGGQVWVILSAGQVLAVSAEERPVCMAAFDIGTTTVAAYLLDARDGRELAVSSCLNPQAPYGADVINRANYVLEHGTAEITGCIREAVSSLIVDMTAQAGVTAEDVYAVSIAGNTCMHHLFLGISPDSLVHAPYNPAVSSAMLLRASDFGIRAARRALLWMLPNIAGFVGADTVACLISSEIADQAEWTLLIDIGTNGEMVLARGGELAACSTAAGPAFEGAGISCGMRGSEGAISAVRFDENGSWDYDVIGDVAPVGICGSGLLDAAACLLRSGRMDETGELEDGELVLADETVSGSGKPVPADVSVSGSGEPVPADESMRGSDRLMPAGGSGRKVSVTQKDIRSLQLAKAAIASGVHLLAGAQGIALGEISQVWLAGAFGSFLSPESACDIGLIPPVLRGRIRPIGNAAGEGAKCVLRDVRRFEEAKALAARTKFLELATLPEFQDRFVDELSFPEEESYA